MNYAGKTAVVAIGGNSLIVDKRHQSINNQYEAATSTVSHIAEMISTGIKVVMTHGNGPQVGFILRRSEIASNEVPTVPMDYAGADTQGAIGYMLQKALHNELQSRQITRQTVTLVTQLRVDHDDPAFDNPTKPVGAVLDEATARTYAETLGWHVMQDAGSGWRQVVPSPVPREIIELKAIQMLVDSGFVLIACGGGGIPVVRDDAGYLQGVEAVIDKDIASALLAKHIGAQLLIISTGVPKVAVNFNQPDQQWLDRLTVAQAKQLVKDNEFDKGSMEPKIEAAIMFIEGGGEEVIITNPQNITAALKGQTGTHIMA